MSTENVKLIGAWPSPFVMRARIALNIKSVDYEVHEEQLLRAKSELLLKSNPVYKKVPVLIHGDKTVCESLVIVQYIDEAWGYGPSIMPSGPYDRAIARFWSAYIDDKLFPAMSSIVRSQEEEAKKGAMNQVIESLSLLEGAFVNISKGKTFFGGDHIGYLDISLGSLIGWIKVIELSNGVKLVDEAKTPNLAKWADEFCSEGAVKDVMPETEKLIEFAKTLVGRS